MSDIESRIEALTAQVAELTATQANILAQVNLFIEQAQPILAQALPTIEALANAPMFRMLTGGGKTSGKR